MRTLPLIYTPNPQLLLAVDDAQISLVAVQLQPSAVVVFARALVDDPQSEEDAYGRALEGWAAAGRVGQSPDDPGVRRFRRLSIGLSDDAETTYTLCKEVAGGSGRLFEAEWHFEGRVPDHARLLVVTATAEDGRHGSAHVDL